MTEDKKAESNPPKNTQTEEESTNPVEEAQITTSAPKSDAEDKPKVEVTNPSMTGIQQQKLSEILNRLSSASTIEDQQMALRAIELLMLRKHPLRKRKLQVRNQKSSLISKKNLMKRRKKVSILLMTATKNGKTTQSSRICSPKLTQLQSP